MLLHSPAPCLPRRCLEVGCGSGYVVYIITGCPNWKTQLNSLPHRCLEVGCGSGYVICSLALLLRELGIAAQLLATDINPQAAAATRATLAAHEASEQSFGALLLWYLLGGRLERGC